MDWKHYPSTNVSLCSKKSKTIALKLLLTWTICTIFAGNAVAQNPPNPLALPGCIKLRSKLDQRTSYGIQNATLRTVAKDFFEIPIYIDRRIDLDTRFDFKEPEQKIETTIEHIADRFSAEVAWIENTLYICPKSKAEPIEAAYWRLYQKLGKTDKKGSSFQWKRSETPSEILKRWCDVHHFESDDAGALEHDIWDAGEFVDCSLAAQLTMLLAGFDLTADVDKDSNHLAWKKLSSETIVQAKFKPTGASQAFLQEWKNKWPQAKAQFTKTQWTVAAPPRAHRDLLLISKAPNTSTKTNPNEDPFARERFSLKFEGRLSDIFEVLQRDYQLELQPWPLPKNVAERIVKIDVAKVDMNGLLSAIGESAGLSIQRSKRDVDVNVK